MQTTSRPLLARSLRLGLFIAAVIGVSTGLFAWRQVEDERRIDLEDASRRAQALAQQLSASVQRSLSLPGSQAREALRPILEGYRRLLGYAVYYPDGRLFAAGKAVAEFTLSLAPVAAEAARAGTEIVKVERYAGSPVHLLAMPLKRADGTAQAVLIVMHDVTYLDERATTRLVEYTFWILIVALLAVLLIMGLTWFIYERPMHKLADWMRRLRVEEVSEAPPKVPVAGLRSETDRLAASLRAARSTGRGLSRAAVHAEQVWTRDRLRAHAVTALGPGRQLIVVSNREPYMHQLHNGRPHLVVPAGGLVTALDPVLQACGGTWIAHGAGDADRETVDVDGRLTVPPSNPHYTLKRVWLTREAEQGYYYGFSNEGLWPLCHLAHERPVFRADDWEHYQQVNRRFADAVLAEIGAGGGMVLVQDYQLALVPQMLRRARPDLHIGIFWHIPWPSSDTLLICPYGPEILAGMLGADIIGFHLPQFCNNFLDSVDRMIESRLDRDQSVVTYMERASCVRSFPISVQSWAEKNVPDGEALEQRIAELKRQHKLEGVFVAVGVDRVDYTKGLVERLRAIDRFLEKYPAHRGHFTFVELGAPSRTHIRRYRDLLAEIEALADEINWKHQTDGWKPVRLLLSHHDAPMVYAFLRMASACIVSSLHDGMNLVAKEYVAAKDKGDGVLILSEFAGAARELTDALIINPYNTEQFAETIRAAVEMEPGERQLRMSRLYRTVEENNIYRWAGSILTELAAMPGREASTQDLSATGETHTAR